MNDTIPVLLIRGLLREERHWGSFPGYMQGQFPDRPVLTISLAGTGIRHKETSPASISEMTDDLRSELNRKHPEYRCYDILGLSMGGMIAIDWAIRFPDQLNRVILMNTSVRQFGKFYQRMQWQGYISLFKTMFSDTYGKEAETLKLVSNNPFDRRIAEQWTRLRTECPMSAQTMINQLRACANFKGDKKPEVATLVLASAKDKMVSPKCSYKMAESWNLKTEVHPTAGHDISIDDPGWVCKVMKNFLDGK